MTFFNIPPLNLTELTPPPIVQQEDHKGMHFMNGHWMKNSEMGHMMHMHEGTLGDFPRAQEGSGTSWLPASSPHYMFMPGPIGRYDFEVMGQFQAGYTSSGGPRGSNQAFSDSMIMLDAPRTFAGGQKINFRLMTSLDPILDGESGVPNLFQTGETAFGKPLVDRQHPHNIFSEVAASYSTPITSGWRVFVYGGPVGEPALGGPMFMHRPSGMEVPEAPISHHWFDSTHISNGVVTLGLMDSGRWKADASYFNGREPGENRYVIDPIKLDSAAGRLTYNPSPDLSLSASYGYLKSPEAQDPLVPEHRLTASAYYNRSIGDSNLAVGVMFGRNIKPGITSDGYNVEATLSSDSGSIFTRYENVGKDELTGVPAGTYTVNKLILGAVKNYSSSGGFEYGLGAYIGLYAFPSSLDPYYGKGPVTFGVFWRIRPGKM